MKIQVHLAPLLAAVFFARRDICDNYLRLSFYFGFGSREFNDMV
jgi:hypothetical protein